MEEIKTTESNQTIEKHKKPKKLIVLFIIIGLILIFLMFFLILSKPKKTAKEELGSAELTIYNALIEGINNFYNPQSVKILECSYIHQSKIHGDIQNPYFISAETGHCYIKITATTKGGGTSNEVYCLVAEENTKYPCGSMWTWDDVMESVESIGLGKEISMDLGFDKNSDYFVDLSGGINVGRLNKALKEHWEEIGLD